MSSGSQFAEEKEFKGEALITNATNSDPDAEFGGFEERRRLERRLLRKLDCRMFIMVVIYILNYIDRNNAAAARLKGFEEDLGLKGQEFNTLLSILYVGYILMQIPSNMFLNYIGRPSLYLPVCMMLWGTISILTVNSIGITKNFTGALLTRFFLGFIEAAFFPGALFLISKWYTRSELGLRTAILYCGNIISNAFGSLLASGILDGMQGKAGEAGWRWLFYIEGGLTVLVAFLAIFILPDFPTTTRWLTPEEHSLALRRMAEDGGINIDDQEGAEQVANNVNEVVLGTSSRLARFAHHGQGFLLAVSDWKIWWLMIAFTSQVTALSFNAFFPTLGATLGFDSTVVTLLAISPPWFLASVVAFLNSSHSDKQGERFYHIIVPLLVGLLGFIIAMSTMNTVARYISLCLMVLSYCGYIIMFAWISNSVPRPPSKRAVALAFINCLSQTGNIAGSYMWPKSWGPTYRKSYGICIALQSLNIIMCWIFRKHLKNLNEQLERDEQERGEQEKGFRYLL